MSDFFRVKIVAKRQVTLPALMLDSLNLQEGDELEFEVVDGQIASVKSLKLVPVDYFSPQILEMLKLRSEEMKRGVYEAAPQSSGDAVEDSLRRSSLSDAPYARTERPVAAFTQSERAGRPLGRRAKRKI